MSRSDKKGLELVNKEYNGRFVVPVPLSKVTNDLPNNVFSAQKRLMSLQKKAMGDDDLFEFIKAFFIEMQENAYIAKIQSGVYDNSVWY